jgi:hypothetical protein
MSLTALLLVTVSICMVSSNVVPPRHAVATVLEHAGLVIEHAEMISVNTSQCVGEKPNGCWYGNPTTPYFFPSFDGVFPPRFKMKQDHALVWVTPTPPEGRYFGFTPYLYSRHIGGEHKPLFASIADTTNHETIGVDCPDGSTAPFNCITVLVFTGSRTTFVAVKEALLRTGTFKPEAINLVQMPNSTSVLRMGLGTEADTFNFQSRFSLFENETEGAAFVAKYTDLSYSFLASPSGGTPPAPFPESVWRPSDARNLEVDLVGVLASLRVKVINDGKDRGWFWGQAVAFDPFFTFHRYQNGFSCIDKDVKCGADNPDALYQVLSADIPTPGANASYILSARDVMVLTGVIHTLTNKTTYMTMAVNNQAVRLGVLGIPDTRMVGSASVLLPGQPQADNLYAHMIARNCSPELFPVGSLIRTLAQQGHCSALPTHGLTGVALDDLIVFVERSYMSPATSGRPATFSVLPPMLLTFKDAIRADPPVIHGGTPGTPGTLPVWFVVLCATLLRLLLNRMQY